MNVKYASAPARFSVKMPIFAWARSDVCMGRPQPGQNTAESGICAEQ
jgi:hypothetical protein